MRDPTKRQKDYPLPITHPPCPHEGRHHTPDLEYMVAVHCEAPMILGRDIQPKYHWVCLGCGQGWWQGWTW